MFQGWIDRVLAAPTSPTADLYFQNAGGAHGWRNAELLAPTVVAGPNRVLIMRHAGRAGELPDRPCVFFIDDDIPAGLNEPDLPTRYRRKLALLEWPAWRRLLPSAARVVAASNRLAARLRRQRPDGVDVLTPYWSEPFAPLDHHDTDGPLDIAYLGSSVHRGDLAFLLPVLEAVLAAEPRARVHLAPRHPLPGTLSRHPRVCRLPGRGWQAYRRNGVGRRFHIALYPLRDTAFNRARSANKLIEHAVHGAASVWSCSWPEARRVADGHSGLVVANDPQVWTNATLSLLRDARARRSVAAEGQRLARKLNDPAPQRKLWTELLGIVA